MATILIAIGLGACCVAVVVTRRTVHVTRTWTRTTATVVHMGVRHQEGLSFDETTEQRWVEVSFVDHVGIERTEKRFVQIGHAAARYRQGQRISIFSNPANLSDIRINSASELWFWPVLLGILGVSFIAAGFNV